MVNRRALNDAGIVQAAHPQDWIPPDSGSCGSCGFGPGHSCHTLSSCLDSVAAIATEDCLHQGFQTIQLLLHQDARVQRWLLLVLLDWLGIVNVLLVAVPVKFIIWPLFQKCNFLHVPFIVSRVQRSEPLYHVVVVVLHVDHDGVHHLGVVGGVAGRYHVTVLLSNDLFQIIRGLIINWLPISVPQTWLSNWNGYSLFIFLHFVEFLDCENSCKW